MKTKVFIFLFDGFSDWEIAYSIPEINKNEEFELIYFSKDGELISSMGGLQILPNISLKDVAVEEIDMLILPGGVAWEKGKNKELEKLTVAVFERKKTIAAICAATTYLGQLGLLNDLKHTSNDLNYLKEIASEYRGEESYQHLLAVTDKNIITANGIAPIEFAKEIFSKLKLYSSDDLEKWFQLFKNGVWVE